MKDSFKNLILIQGGKYLMFDNQKDLVKYLLGDDYYKLSSIEKIKRLEFKTLINSIGNKNLYDNDFVVKDEKNFVYWLLLNTDVVLLEKKNSNYFTKNLDKTKIYDDYIIVNKYAKHLLDIYINEKK